MVYLMSSQPNVVLIGLMAVGKSTVGKHIADLLRRPFFDTDRLIEERAGAETAWIFDVEGESGFREREAHVIDELMSETDLVIATGGGAILREENRAALARGVVVHLDASVGQLMERTRNDRKRPLLQGGNRRAVLEKLVAERTPLYAGLRDYRFSASRGGPKALAQRIVNALVKDGRV